MLCRSTGPVIIHGAQQAQFKLSMHGIPVGNYDIVLCVSFNDTNIDDIEQWILDIRPSDGKLYPLVMSLQARQAFIL